MSDPLPVLDLAAARPYVRALGGLDREVAVLLFLDARRHLLGIRHVMGARGRVDLPIRGIAADVIAFGATGLVVAHNHPGGDARPSDRDRAFTRALATALSAIDVVLVDHLIVAGPAVASLRALGAL